MSNNPVFHPSPDPIPANQPLPHRKVIRSWLLPLAERTTVRALVLLAFDYVLLSALAAGAVLLESTWLKLACGIGMGFVTGRLFILGHDACHQSLTPHRRLKAENGRSKGSRCCIAPYRIHRRWP